MRLSRELQITHALKLAKIGQISHDVSHHDVTHEVHIHKHSLHGASIYSMQIHVPLALQPKVNFFTIH